MRPRKAFKLLTRQLPRAPVAAALCLRAYRADRQRDCAQARPRCRLRILLIGGLVRRLRAHGRAGDLGIGCEDLLRAHRAGPAAALDRKFRLAQIGDCLAQSGQCLIGVLRALLGVAARHGGHEPVDSAG